MQTLDHSKLKLPTKSGFTLVEVMVSMVVLAVVFTAISAMNFSSITSYTSSRDTTEASLISEKVITILQAEAEQWTPTPTSNRPTGVISPYYRDVTGLKNSSFLQALTAASNEQWVSLDAGYPISSSNQPVKDSSGNETPGRFCVAARRIDFANTSTAYSQLNALRIQIAIYYPGPTIQGISRCTDLLPSGNLQAISQGTYPGEASLRQLGTRTEFFSTIITPTQFK